MAFKLNEVVSVVLVGRAYQLWMRRSYFMLFWGFLIGFGGRTVYM